MERHKEDTGDYSRSTQDYTYFPVLLPEDSPPLSREECDSIVGNTLLKLEDSLAEVGCIMEYADSVTPDHNPEIFGQLMEAWEDEEKEGGAGKDYCNYTGKGCGVDSSEGLCGASYIS